MRRMMVWVPEGAGGTVAERAREHGATTTVQLAGHDDGRPLDVLVLHVPNRRAGDVVGGLSGLDGLHLSMLPQGVLALHPPPDEAPEQVTDVTLRSPVEIFLSSLQSVGSWTGFMSYAAIAGAVVWVGLATSSVFLLTAAMLIAPFAEPAMTAAIGTARGDTRLVGRSVVRYLAALTVTVAVAAALTVVFGLERATDLMVTTANVSVTTMVLPIAAGAAGAVNLAQSERSSLVSGAATGMLVAVALAPPAGVVGIATVLGDAAMVRSSLFLLGLQLVGINLAGAAVFRLVGLRPEGPRFPAGRRPVPAVAASVTVVLLAALVAWQALAPAQLQREDIAQQAEETAASAVDEDTALRVVEVSARLTGAEPEGRPALLVTGHVLDVGSEGATQDAEAALTERVRSRLHRQFPEVLPLVDLNVVAASS